MLESLSQQIDDSLNILSEQRTVKGKIQKESTNIECITMKGTAPKLDLDIKPQVVCQMQQTPDGITQRFIETDIDSGVQTLRDSPSSPNRNYTIQDDHISRPGVSRLLSGQESVSYIVDGSSPIEPAEFGPIASATIQKKKVVPPAHVRATTPVDALHKLVYEQDSDDDELKPGNVPVIKGEVVSKTDTQTLSDVLPNGNTVTRIINTTKHLQLIKDKKKVVISENL